MRGGAHLAKEDKVRPLGREPCSMDLGRCAPVTGRKGVVCPRASKPQEAPTGVCSQEGKQLSRRWRHARSHKQLMAKTWLLRGLQGMD